MCSWSNTSPTVPSCSPPTQGRSTPPGSELRESPKSPTQPGSRQAAPLTASHARLLRSLGSLLPGRPVFFLPIFKSWVNASSNPKPPLILLSGTNLSFLNASAFLCSAPLPLLTRGRPATLLKSPQKGRFLDELLVGVHSSYQIVDTQGRLSGGRSCPSMRVTVC